MSQRKPRERTAEAQDEDKRQYATGGTTLEELNEM